MIRTVVNILKKHLAIGYSSYEEMWEALELSSYDVLLEQPDHHQLKRLARELISVIGDIDTAKLVKIPSQQEAKDFLKSCMLTDVDEEFLDYHARYMRLWLAGLKRFYLEGMSIAVVRTDTITLELKALAEVKKPKTEMDYQAEFY